MTEHFDSHSFICYSVMIILYFEQVVHYELSEEHRQRDS